MKYDWSKLEVGQSVYLVEPNHRGGVREEGYSRVDKIGRLYFHTGGRRFNRSNGTEAGFVNTLLASQCYPTKTAYEEMKAAARLRQEVVRFIRTEELPDELIIELGDVIRRYKREHGYAT